RELFSILGSDVYNASVIFEDATRFAKRFAPEDLVNYCWDSKQKNVDLTFNYHYLSAIPTDLIQASDTLTIFNSKDDRQRVRSKFVNPYVWEVLDHLQKNGKQFENYTLEL